MCFGSTPSAPTPAAALPEAPRTPDPSATGSTADADKRRRAAATGEGRASTILTGPRGVQNGAATTTKTLLGA